MGLPYWTLILGAWVLIGVAAVVVVLYRRGHREGSWLLIGGVLGPLTVPVAIERARRETRRLERHRVRGADGTDPDRWPCALIGVDGSPESEAAVRTAARLTAPVARRLILATVVSADALTAPSDDERDRARDLLSRYGRQLPAGAAQIETQILTGQPAAALLELAEAEDVDVIVVGRRGRGLSRMVLGSVATTLSTGARCPVLLAAPPDRAA